MGGSVKVAADFNLVADSNRSRPEGVFRLSRVGIDFQGEAVVARHAEIIELQRSGRGSVYDESVERYLLRNAGPGGAESQKKNYA